MALTFKDRTAWLEWRRGGLGASDIMQILLPAEHRPYGGQWDVWLSKTQPVDESNATEAMGIGNWLERPIGQWVANDVGLTLEEADAVEGRAYWMRATPDFWLVDWVNDTRANAVGLECKVSGHPRMWSAGVPPYVMLQAIWCMLVTDTDTWRVGAYLPGSWKRAHWLVQRDEALAGAVIDMAWDWWQRHILDEVPPDIDGSDSCARALSTLYPAITETVVLEASESENQLLAELVQIKRRTKEDAARKRLITNSLGSIVGVNKGISGSSGSMYWDARKASTRFDLKRFKVEYPALSEQFNTTGKPSRVARTVEPKEDT